VDGAGKSSLARQLAVAIDGARYVDADAYVVAKQDRFFDALRMDELRDALTQHGDVVIFSGICMLQVLETLDLKPDLLVYVKRMRRWGWADEGDVTDSDSEAICSQPDIDADEPSMQREVRAYHLTYMPHHRTDIVLERLDLN